MTSWVALPVVGHRRVVHELRARLRTSVPTAIELDS